MGSINANNAIALLTRSRIYLGGIFTDLISNDHQANYIQMLKNTIATFINQISSILNFTMLTLLKH